MTGWLISKKQNKLSISNQQNAPKGFIYNPYAGRNPIPWTLTSNSSSKTSRRSLLKHHVLGRTAFTSQCLLNVFSLRWTWSCSGKGQQQPFWRDGVRNLRQTFQQVTIYITLFERSCGVIRVMVSGLKSKLKAENDTISWEGYEPDVHIFYVLAEFVIQNTSVIFFDQCFIINEILKWASEGIWVTLTFDKGQIVMFRCLGQNFFRGTGSSSG